MENWEFQCSKEVFIDFIEELSAADLIELQCEYEQIEKFLEKFLKRHFMDYFYTE